MAETRSQSKSASAAKHRQDAIRYAQMRDLSMTDARDPSEAEPTKCVQAARKFHHLYLHAKAIANLYAPDPGFTA